MSICEPQSRETTAANYAIFSAVAIIAQQIAGKATRDALFLSYFEVTDLPKIVIVGGMISILAVMMMSKLLSRYGPASLIPVIFTMSGLLHIGEWVLYKAAPETATILLYVHIAVFSAILISGFWSVVNERFNPYTAKRTVARITVGATFGGLVGGFMVERVSNLMDLQAMLLILAGLHVVCGFGVLKVGKALVPQPSSNPVISSGSRVLLRTPYLLQMVALMILTAMVSTLLEYALKTEAANRFESTESLVTFFASFYTIAGVLAFLVQATLGRRSLSSLGLGGTIALLPGSIVLGGIVGVILTNIWSVVVLRGVHTALVHSLFRSGFELLYVPLSSYKKRPTKILIDVGSDRIGDIIGGGLVLLLVSSLIEVPTVLVIGSALIASVLALGLIYRLHHGYVDQLSLRLRTQRLISKERPLSNLHGGQARMRVGGNDALVVASISSSVIADNEDRTSSTHPLSVERIDTDSGFLSDRVDDSVLDTRGILRSGSIAQIRQVLQDRELVPALAPHVISWLDHTELEPEVVRSLVGMGPAVIDQLVDGMLGKSFPLSIRCRLPLVLEKITNEKTLDETLAGLLSGLSSQTFEVRYQIGRTLERIKVGYPHLQLTREVIFSAVKREMTLDGNDGNESFSTRRNVLPKLVGSTRGGEPIRDKYILDHVLTLLGLVLDKEAMQLCQHALNSNDAHLRGTAIEYLENILPESIRVGLIAAAVLHSSTYPPVSLVDE